MSEIIKYREIEYCYRDFCRIVRKEIRKKGFHRDMVITGRESDEEVGGNIQYNIKKGKGFFSKFFGRKILNIYSSIYGSPQNLVVTYYDGRLKKIVEDNAELFMSDLRKTIGKDLDVEIKRGGKR